MGKALVIIDVQNDYFKNGRCELVGSEEALLNVEKLLDFFRKNQLPVYFIQHISEGNAGFFLPDTEGADIHQKIQPLSGDKVLIKHEPNSFYQTGLLDELKAGGVNELVVCGMMTHMCVDTTVRAAKDSGFQVTLIEDACATKDLEYGGKKIPAQVVQDVYMASLNYKFAEIIKADVFMQA